MKALILGPKDRDPIGWWQISPFYTHRRQLKKLLGFKFSHKEAYSVEYFQTVLGKKNDADVFFIRPQWRDDPEEVESFFRWTRDTYPTKKIVLIDPFDQTSSRFFSSLPYVDCMVKYQSLKDKSLYLNTYPGGNMQTGRLVNQGYDLKGWHVGSAVSPGEEHKIFSGWFAVEQALVDKFRSPLRRFTANKKDIDLFCHVSCGRRDNIEWYGMYRKDTIDKLGTLTAKYNVSVNADFSGEPRIPRKEYLSSVKRSRILFSPLGWGEVTMRAYESVVNRSLLIQPSVEHLEVHPNIFIKDKTYIPIKWDLSDIVEKVSMYIENESLCDEIVENANAALQDYFDNNEFVNLVERVLAY